ncbi:zinc finger protein, putative [Plasmodium chabaudi chabaudi]|uniref:Zinc finger protein, putative n=1 Tax=Plasmodium chabaudi chabaudi TaxID=31271 RepID=A0A1C6YPW2_PLACU|nr:zinc finger protein, putative [Plasmodium chabaudi chabaudi]SCN62452.1 zinc finger protein, putative [Plasmodium chabaudi chabaudi]
MMTKNVNNQSPLVVTQIPRKKQFYKTKMCPWFFSGRCDRGIDCLFAHSQEELNPIPDLSFTSLCPLAKKSGLCKNEKCSYAHSVCELRPTGDLYKTAPCTKFLRGKCNAESHCRHAHYIEELRPLPGNISPSQNAINLMLAAPLTASMQKISKPKNNFFMDENRGNLNNNGVGKKNEKDLKNSTSISCNNYSLQNSLNNTRFGKKYMKNASVDNSILLGTSNMDLNPSNSNNSIHSHVTSNMNNNNELAIHNNINENILNNIMNTTNNNGNNNMNKPYRKSSSYSSKLYALLKGKDNKDGNNMNNLKFKSFLMNNHDMNNTNNANASNSSSGILSNFNIRKIHSAGNKSSDNTNGGYKSINEMMNQDMNMNCSINSNNRGGPGALVKKGTSMTNNNSMVKTGNGNMGGSNMSIGMNTKMNSNVSMASGHSNITNQHYGINRGQKNDGLHYSSFSTKEPSSPMRIPSNSSKEYAEGNETNLVDTIEHMEITAQDSVLKVIEDDNEKFNTSDIKKFFKLLQMTNANNYNDENFLYNDADMNQGVNNNMYEQYKSPSIPANIMKQQMNPDLSRTPEQYSQNNNVNNNNANNNNNKYDINDNIKNIYKINNNNLASCSNFWNFPEDEFPAPASKIAQDVEIFDY